MDTALWWSGLVAWIACGMVGILWIFDQASDFLIRTMWGRKECVAFIADRIKRRSSAT